MSNIGPVSVKNQKCIGCKMDYEEKEFIGQYKFYKRCTKCRSQHRKIAGGDLKYVCNVCKNRAVYNFKGIKFGIRCKKHIELGMIDVCVKKCIHTGCEESAYFNSIGETIPLYCNEHKLSGMTNTIKKCIFENCSKIPSFNYENETKGLYCSSHKLLNMINVTISTCISDGCRKTPSFNYRGEIKGLYCKNHANFDMINVKKPKCHYIGCDTIPTYNDIGETRALYCKLHAGSEMIDVKNKKCIFTGCNINPTYGNRDETKRLYCKPHAKPGMVNLAKRTCKFENCGKTAFFNIKDETKPLYCFDHATVEMENIVSKKCEKCETHANYGIPGNSVSRCAKHKEEGMIMRPNKQCENDECKNKASYGSKTPIHCEEHAENNEFNLLLKKCVKCSKIEICNKDGYCYEYCINGEYYIKSKKYKELRIMCLLNNQIDMEPLLSNKIINFRCNSKRPDRIYDCGTYFLVIEIDEHQHRAYGCELNRMYLIAQALGMPVIFLRYNPDEFKNNNKNAEITNNQREDILIQWVKYLMNSQPTNQDQYLRCAYLFYDNHIQTTENIENVKLPDNFFSCILTYDIKKLKPKLNIVSNN